MRNLKAIRKRINSVRNTQKITKAMKMVAAARLRRAQESILRLRPYALKTMEVLSDVAARAVLEGDEHHPLLQRREEKNVLFVVLTSDRGLAGSFNANVNRFAFRKWIEFETNDIDVSFAAIGRKGRDFLRRRNAKIDFEWIGLSEASYVSKSSEVARWIGAEYANGRYDSVYLIYNEFKSAISQKVVCERILPIEPTTIDENKDVRGDFVYEPNKKVLLDSLLPIYVQVEVYRALLESVASEHGARMTAMDNATKNASEMIEKLTLMYNRARQAAITKELVEIISGAEALKG
ncbi:MAG: ATP synthase F1 subunit gamma [Sandaracinaceae bacterium]|nr:ATP synthase F1 subunit gamma [Sandaracinaceae bacterium]